MWLYSNAIDILRKKFSVIQSLNLFLHCSSATKEKKIDKQIKPGNYTAELSLLGMYKTYMIHTLKGQWFTFIHIYVSLPINSEKLPSTFHNDSQTETLP